MNRIGRRAFIARAFAMLALGALSVGTAYGGAGALDADKLKAALRVKTDAEADFVDDVVEKVSQGALPYKIFYAAYKYAMRKAVGLRVRYFKICLENLVKQAGLKISFLSF